MIEPTGNRWLRVAVAVACAVLTAPQLPAAERPGVGDPAPKLAVKDRRGETRTLDEARLDGPMVVVFFRGTW